MFLKECSYIEQKVYRSKLPPPIGTHPQLLMFPSSVGGGLPVGLSEFGVTTTAWKRFRLRKWCIMKQFKSSFLQYFPEFIYCLVNIDNYAALFNQNHGSAFNWVFIETLKSTSGWVVSFSFFFSSVASGFVKMVIWQQKAFNVLWQFRKRFTKRIYIVQKEILIAIKCTQE